MRRLQNYLIVGTLVVLPFFYRTEVIDPVLVPRFLILSAVLLLILITSLVGRGISSGGTGVSVLRRGIMAVILGYLVVSAVAVTQATCLSEATGGTLKFSFGGDSKKGVTLRKWRFLKHEKVSSCA